MFQAHCGTRSSLPLNKNTETWYLYFFGKKVTGFCGHGEVLLRIMTVELNGESNGSPKKSLILVCWFFVW